MTKSVPQQHPEDVVLSAGAREHLVEAGAATTSAALRDIPEPDYCDVVIVPTKGVREPDPRVWAEAIFAHENVPLSTRGARALRDEAVRLLDMVPPPEKEYVTDEVIGAEALIRDDTPHLRVRIGVALLPGGRLLQVTTAVQYLSLRGRLSFGPKRLTHAAAVNTLARRAPTTVKRRAVRALRESEPTPVRRRLGAGVGDGARRLIERARALEAPRRPGQR